MRLISPSNRKAVSRGSVLFAISRGFTGKWLSLVKCAKNRAGPRWFIPSSCRVVVVEFLAYLGEKPLQVGLVGVCEAAGEQNCSIYGKAKGGGED